MHGTLSRQLERHVTSLCELGPRVPSRPLAIRSTIAQIEQFWHEVGLPVRREPFQTLYGPACNLITEIPGRSRRREIVVLGAHYDTVDTTPGADDNASAIAVLLETSRRLAKVFGERTIRFVAFACEEPPYFNLGQMGSQHHARECKRRKEKLVGMICLEMVGYFQCGQPQPLPASIPKVFRYLVPKEANFIAAVSNFRSFRLLWQFSHAFRRGCSLPLCARALPSFVPEIWLSDHRGFWEQGYPAIMLTDTSFLRNPNYHLPSDLPDTLDYSAMAEVTHGTCAAIRTLARVVDSDPPCNTSLPITNSLNSRILGDAVT